MRDLLGLVVGCVLLVLTGCHGKDDDPLASARAAATIACQRINACYSALGTEQQAYADCDADTLHVIRLCENGCITALWAQHDQRLDAGQPLPTACRCTADVDCAPDVRRCDTTTGACVEGAP